MNDPQVLQNKAAKIILNRPLYSSATDAVETLKWLNLEQRRFYHPCTYVYKCINGRVGHSIELLANRNIPNYNTRNRNMLGLPLATKNWGKQRVRYHSLKDQNNLDKATKLSVAFSAVFIFNSSCFSGSFLSTFDIVFADIFISKYPSFYCIQLIFFKSNLGPFLKTTVMR